MSTIELTLPDGSVCQLATGSTGLDVAASLGKKLAKDAVAVVVDGELTDLRVPLERDASVRIVTRKDAEALGVLRHSMVRVSSGQPPDSDAKPEPSDEEEPVEDES